MSMCAEEASQEPMLMGTSRLLSRAAKWIGFCCFARVLFPIIHLLEECFRLLLIYEG